MEEKTFSPHPLTGASGTYRLNERGGYDKISDMDVSNESRLEKTSTAMNKAMAEMPAAPTSIRGNGLLGTSTPDTREARELLQGFEQTQGMVDADDAIAQSNPEDNPEDWQFISGIGNTYIGPARGQNTASKMTSYLNRGLGGPRHDARRQHQTGSFGWHRGGDLMELAREGQQGVGWGGFTQEGWDARKDAGFSGFHPLIDTNPNDLAAIMEMYKSDTYNPYGKHEEKIHKGSVADFMYGIAKDNYGIRAPAYQALRNETDLGSTRMNQRMWNKYGFDKSIGDYSTYSGTPAGNPMTGGLSGDNPMSGTSGSETRGSGFLEAYNKQKEELRNKPSVLSLFKEMEEF